ncbi:anti-phage protein KwaA [Plebeiibacterium sediminum]|uniref:Uncharacterized protein n=1 Tax=Plebeiibacterium sediminum TaxID=2992112 RepID=A0AAE3SHP1_9BACT|nr:anti-phage protein KwaA [Plebeiobacterium sediminum]MCW3788298.1 hypothetical protein [Plebeiobacterium sediminum]
MTKYKIGLYIVSLILLFVSIIIKTYYHASFEFCRSWDCVSEYAKHNIPTLICLFFILLGLIIYKLYFKELNGEFAHPKTIKTVENISNNHLSFLATYILPFVTFDFKDERNWIILIFMLVVIGIIYVKANFFYTNPTLSLFGVYVYNVSFESDDSKIIAISRGKLKSGDIVKRRLIEENIYFVK